MDRKSSYSSSRDTGLLDITLTLPLTAGSITMVVPVASATNLINSWMSVSFRLTVKSWASTGARPERRGENCGQQGAAGHSA